ncbi:hypothetical protein Kfla_3545 [Kribbella flavida DSM 17836]|uniref:Uncharacterized protein n=1 Tax=Kribbella flavida (strain DSM 17836 / JCM 10339 / NBRC 14399) TaxID=479435 RepID=D2PMQ0_KRIFD|nr:hypothetical protein [Kribbella flavida]ADB32602.1 hypothetical protein Kfla_3545 [Kribbella flavida DSM 17836]
MRSNASDGVSPYPSSTAFVASAPREREPSEVEQRIPVQGVTPVDDRGQLAVERVDVPRMQVAVQQRRPGGFEFVARLLDQRAEPSSMLVGQHTGSTDADQRPHRIQQDLRPGRTQRPAEEAVPIRRPRVQLHKLTTKLRQHLGSVGRTHRPPFHLTLDEVAGAVGNDVGSRYAGRSRQSAGADLGVGRGAALHVVRVPRPRADAERLVADETLHGLDRHERPEPSGCCCHDVDHRPDPSRWSVQTRPSSANPMLRGPAQQHAAPFPAPKTDCRTAAGCGVLGSVP